MECRTRSHIHARACHVGNRIAWTPMQHRKFHLGVDQNWEMYDFLYLRLDVFQGRI